MTLKDYSLDGQNDAPDVDEDLDGNTPFDMGELETFASIDSLNLEQELLLQYAHIKRLRNWVVGDRETPTNQKAQVMNTCTNLLVQLTKSQTALWEAERMKKLESCLIRCLNKLPEHAVKAFLEDYKQAIGELENAT